MIKNKFLSLLFISIFILCCRTNNYCQSSKNALVKFNGLYVWNNGFDTIIKDYAMYQKLRDHRLFEQIGINMLDSGFTIAPGSRNIEYLKFYKKGFGLLYSSHKKFNLYEAIQKIDTLKKQYKKGIHDEKLLIGEIIKYNLIGTNQISFIRGGQYNVILTCEGIFGKDSLFLRTKLNNGEYYYPDSIKVFKFFNYH